MAKYLWVGMGATGVSASAQNIVDQYCFNKSGNWYSKQLINGTLKWAYTTATPGNGDFVVFGLDPNASNAGATAAMSPCLFGGFSGGVGAGVWANTGATATSGTTFTSPLQSVVVSGVQTGYKFPYLGGGISGDIATWCASRDGVGATYYAASNTTGFRDPSQNLRLKVSQDIYINNTATYLSSVADGITNVANYNYTNKFVMDFDAVKATTPLAGGTAGSAGTGSNPIVTTGLVSYCGGGAGLRVRGGSFKYVQINTNTYGMDAVRTNPYSYIADYGVEFYNAYVDTLTIAKAQATYIYGCTASAITVWHTPWEVNTSNHTYTGQVDLEIASNISAIGAYTDLYGITRSTELPSSANILLLKYVPSYIGGSEAVTNPSLTSSTKNVVILGDRVGTKICSIPTINIDAGFNTSGGTGNGGYLYMPWAVEFAGTFNCNTINNNAGYIYSHEDIAQSSTVAVSELRMSNYGTLDFSQRQSQFDDWRFGGFTAAGTQIAGGIVFVDETAKVLGSEGLRLWNTQTKAGGIINARITDTKSTVIPNAEA